MSFWRGSLEAADVLLAACVSQLDRWGARMQYADGALPFPGVYGLPEQSPHVRAAFERGGFHRGDRVETVYLADVADLPEVGEPPLDGLRLSRSVGINGTRLSACRGDDVAGDIEVEILAESERIGHRGRFADIGNLDVVEGERRRGVGTWLVAQAGEWLRFGRVDRVLAYTGLEDEEWCASFLEAVGFRQLTRTDRGWNRTPAAPMGDL